MDLSKYLEFFRFAFGSDNDLLITKDEGEITFVGKNLSRYFGKSPDKMIGDNILSVLGEISSEIKTAWSQLEQKIIDEGGPAKLPVAFEHGGDVLNLMIKAIRVGEDLTSLVGGKAAVISIWQAEAADEQPGDQALPTATLRRAERYRKLFENAPVGIYRSSIDGKIIEANATIAALLKYPTVAELQNINISELFSDPNERAVWLDLASQTNDSIEMRLKLKCKDGSEILVNDTTRPVRDDHGNVQYFDGILEDLSGKADSEVIFDRYTTELTAIHKLANRVNRVLSVQEVVDAALSEIKTSLAPDLCMIFIRSGTSLELLGHHAEKDLKFKDRVHQVGECLCGLAASKNETIISNDIHSDVRCTQDECQHAGVESFIAIPLQGIRNNMGVLSIASLYRKDFTHEKIFLEAIAAQTASALNNAVNYEKMQREVVERRKVEQDLREHRSRLEELVKERTKEISIQNTHLQNEVRDRKLIEAAEKKQRAIAQALENTAAVLNQTHDLDEVLDRILLNLETVVPHDSANIMLLDEKGNARVVRYKGNPLHPPESEPVFSNFTVSDTPTLHRMRGDLKPMVLSNISNEPEWIPQSGSSWIKSYVAAPIYHDDNLLGYLNLVSSLRGFYSEEHAEQLLAFANHASMAIRNVHLFKDARELAAIEERQKLARDMHDGVSQTLFTTSMVADALPKQWERSPEKGKEGLEKIKRLSRGALAEMRSILLELRPGALLEADLGELIEQLGKGAMSYLEISLTTNLQGRHKLPEEIHLPLYRMVQEIFNNIVKHARATHVSIDYENTGSYVYISISDNGKGFNTAELRDDSFGLKIMQERAELIGAALNVISEPQSGTNVSIIWQTNMEEIDHG